MKARFLFVLHVFMVLVSRDVHSTTPCPSTCLPDNQILSCNGLTDRALPMLQTCIESLPNTVVLDLAYNRIGCSCRFLAFTSILLHKNIVVFDSVRCSSHSISICGNRTTSSSKLSGTPADVYHVVFGSVFSARSPHWKRRFDRHYHRLWKILSRLKDAGVRHFYLMTLMRKTRIMEWMVESQAIAEGASSSKAGATSLAASGGAIDTSLNANLTTPMSAKKRHQMIKVVTFSSIVGIVFFLIVIILMCMLESERRNMDKTKIHGDLFVDNALQTRNCTWQNFLEKLAFYKRRKSELGITEADNTSWIAKQLFVEQSRIDYSGEIFIPEYGPAAAVCSVTKLVAMQPLKSHSQLSYNTTPGSPQDRSRTSIGSYRCEPLGVSSWETNTTTVPSATLQPVHSFSTEELTPLSVQTHRPQEEDLTTCQSTDY